MLDKWVLGIAQVLVQAGLLDTVLSIMEVLHDGYGDPKYRPCPLLHQFVKAGIAPIVEAL